jgi:hypothetical protein
MATTASRGTAPTSDAPVFEAVLLGISADNFLAFVDRFLARYTDVGPQMLDWPAPEAGVGAAAFTLPHLDAHKAYCALYESRVRSVLRNAKVSEDDFAGLCAQEMSAGCAASGAVDRRDTQAQANSDKDEGGVASKAQLVAALYEMLECVADFNSFARMMHDRQTGDEDSDDGSCGGEP